MVVGQKGQIMFTTKGRWAHNNVKLLHFLLDVTDNCLWRACMGLETDSVEPVPAGNRPAGFVRACTKNLDLYLKFTGFGFELVQGDLIWICPDSGFAHNWSQCFCFSHKVAVNRDR